MMNTTESIAISVVLGLCGGGAFLSLILALIRICMYQCCGDNEVEDDDSIPSDATTTVVRMASLHPAHNGNNSGNNSGNNKDAAQGTNDNNHSQERH